ncbi:MAG: hypothetical protein D6722_08395 [Bacteroidetes bacterium]|nr:MAG: hypothetical protein D6722_08395 [Bacteroidota bacterium]
MKRVPNSLFLVLGWAFVLLAFAPLLIPQWFEAQAATMKVDQLSNLGEWVGGITAPLLNLAGFVMIYVAFRQQARDGESQQFDQTFFQLLNLHHQNHNTIQTSFRSGQSGSRNFFQFACTYLKNAEASKAEAPFATFYAQQYDHIDLFARHALFAIRYVLDSHLLQPRHREQYMQLLRSQFSTDELSLLKAYCTFFQDQHPDTKELYERLQGRKFFEG